MKAIQGWPTRQLRELADIRVSNVDKKFYASEKPVKLCNYMDVYTNEYVKDNIQFMEASATPAEIEQFSLNRGDVIITKDSETPDDIGIPAVITEEINDLVCGYHLALIRPNQEYLDPVYLAKQLCTSDIVLYFAVKASGSTRFGLSIGAIETIEIPTPPKLEQTKIADILSTVDQAIEQTEALIAKQQRIKTGLMQDLLTRGIDEHGNLRSEQTHEFKDSPLGRIPVEWEVCKLQDLCHLQRGHDLPIQTRKETGNIRVYGSNGVDGYHDKSITKGPGVITGRSGTIGKVHYEKNDYWPLNTTLYVIDFKHNYQRYVYYFLQTIDLKKYAAATGVPSLNRNFIHPLTIIKPSIKEQKRITAILDSASIGLDGEQTNLTKLHSLKTALMQALLTGKKRVTALLNDTEVVHG
ncbi:restriction endonuclease subunit S [bacterium]|nr:restriction endonuclease subunit S [bacterium]